MYKSSTENRSRRSGQDGQTTFSRVGGHLPRLQGAPTALHGGRPFSLETTLPTTELPGPFYRPSKPRPLLAYLDEDEHFFLPTKPDGKALRRLKVLKPFADALSRATEALNWAVQRPDGSWPQEYADKKVHNPFSSQWEPVGSLPVRSCLLSLAGYTCAVGSSDRPGLSLKDLGPERFDRAASSMTFRCIRLDVDCDDAYDRQDRTALRETTDAVREAFRSIGLTSSVWSTGGRGVQAVAPCQPLTWHELKAAEQHLKERLSLTLPAGAKADKGGTEGILRLPFGLHPRTGRLGLFLDEDCRTLPLEQQLGEMLRAYGRSASYLPPVAAVRTSMAQEPLQTRARAEATPETAPARRGRDGAGEDRWQRLRDERPETGGTYAWLNTYGRIHAFVWAYGREGARERLHQLMEEAPLGPGSDMQDRHSRVDYLVDTYVDFKGARKHEAPKDLHADDEQTAADYAEALATEGKRKDTAESHWLVMRAWLHARRTWGVEVDGADVWRMFCHLYGERALARSGVFSALGVMRERVNNICSPISEPVRFEQDWLCLGGYLVTPEAFASTGHSSGSSVAIGQSMDAGHRFQPRKRSSPSARPSQSVHPASSTSRQSRSLPVGAS